MSSVCHLTTGFQGGGKTLYTIWTVEQLRKATGRTVFYSGINELKLEGWEQFGGASKDPTRPWDTDPSEWFKLPDASIIVIDEAQRLFRARSVGSAVPPYVAAMETLRHRGLELFLITQDPMLLDSNVRKLVGDHVHLMRKFGMEVSTAHRFVGVRDNVGKSRKDSMRSNFRFPKSAYDWYKSAEVHTVKKTVPWKIVGLIVALLLVFGFVGYRVSLWGKPHQVEVKSDTSNQVGPAGAAGGARGRASSIGFDSASYQPRVAELPYTAPRYDGMTDPKRVPVIVGCVLRGDPAVSGFCFTQQGTRLYPPVVFIKAWMENGQFVDFDPGSDVRQAFNQAQASGQAGNGPTSGSPADLRPVTN